MTSLELDEWFEYHLCVFDKLRDYFEADPNRKVIWARKLRRVSLRCAKQATEAMLEKVPPYWTNHVERILDYAKTHNGIEGVKRRQSYIDGTEVYNCAVCRDEGTLTVFGREAMDAMRNGSFGWKDCHQLVGVACTCAMGYASLSVRWTKDPLIQFDAKKMVIAACPNDNASVAALAAFFGVAVPSYSPPVHKRPTHVVEQLEGPPIRSVGALVANRVTVKVETPRLEQGPPRVEDYDESEATVSEEPWTEDSPYPF
jgi:hypothetical protein